MNNSSLQVFAFICTNSPSTKLVAQTYTRWVGRSLDNVFVAIKLHLLTCLISSGLIFYSASATAADPQQEILLFLDVSQNQHIRGSSIDDDFIPALDLIYGYSTDKFRLLTEYAISSEENEIERLQAGWVINDENVLWIGRVHTPDNYWNTTFHHGQFLQTSISRPWLDRFEDEGGPLIGHTTGLLLESDYQLNNGAGFSSKVAVGAGPHLESDLEPFDLASPGKSHKLTAQVSIAYIPQYLSSNQFGILASRSDISVSTQNSVAFSNISQNIFGVFVDWSWNKSRVISAFRNITNRANNNNQDSFWGAYVHVERSLTSRWTSYGRFDYLNGEDDSEYLGLLEQTSSRQLTGGLRFDLTNKHAITIEVIDISATNGRLNRTNILVQWSASLL